MARGKLTSAEYKALRQLLGFSQAEAAEFHGLQNLRTIQRWEAGSSWVSDIACEKICALAAPIDATISGALAEAEKCPAGETEIVLIVYPDDCFRQYVAGIGDLPNSVHRAMIARTYDLLRQKGYAAGVVEFNPDDYAAYLRKNGLADGQDVRAAWAVEYRERLLLN